MSKEPPKLGELFLQFFPLNSSILHVEHGTPPNGCGHPSHIRNGKLSQSNEIPHRENERLGATRARRGREPGRNAEVMERPGIRATKRKPPREQRSGIRARKQGPQPLCSLYR